MRRTFLLLIFAINLSLQAPAAICAEEKTPLRVDRFGDPLPPGVLVRLGTLRFHHCGCAAYSPDGKIIVTGDRDGTHVWDAATGKKIRLLPGESWGPDGLIFSHDGKKLAAVDFGGASVQVWDVKTFKTLLSKKMGSHSGGGDWSHAAAFSTDDKMLVAGTLDKLFVWDVATGKKLKEFPLRVKGKFINVRLLAFSEDGKVAATQGARKVHLWDTQTGKLLHEIKLLVSSDTMRFARDGKTLVVPGHGHWMNIFSVETGKKLHSLVISEGTRSMAFSPDGKTLALASNATIGSSSAYGGQLIQLWNLTNLKTPPVKYPAPGIYSVMFSPDGKTLAWSCYGQTLCFMDRATGKDQRPTASHRGTIKSLVWFPDGKRIASAGEDSTIRIWDAATGESLKVLRGHVGEVHGLALFPNGKLLASCGADNTFRLWDIERGKQLSVHKEGNNVRAAAFSADGKQLASGGYRGIVFLRHPVTGKVLEEFEADGMASLAFSPDGKTIAALSFFDRKLFLLNLVTKKMKEIPVKNGGSSVAYSPDGKFLAVGRDVTLLLLDAATHRVLRKLPGHYNRRGCVAFSPDSRYLASVSDGYHYKAKQTIRVFEMATGTEIHTFKRELPIYAAAFSPNGSKLVVGGTDATAVIFDLNNLTGKKRRKQLTAKELAARWESLGARDAGKAYEARVDLLHAPRSTVPFLAKRLKPAPAIDAKRVQAWINDLDSDKFQVRAKATRELEQLGELVREPMRKALAANPTLEKHQRLQLLLDRLDELTPSQLRYVRSIEILEGIGTPEAMRIIERLTKGNADGLATIESRKVIARVRKKNAPLPELPKAQENAVAKSKPVLPTGPVRPDHDGDPMPAGAIARLGSARWRLASEPQRILVSPDGKKLAVVNSYSAVELLDSRTGKSLGKTGIGFPDWFDLRNSVAFSADWRKIAALATGEGSSSFLVVSERRITRKVKIAYCRKKEEHPVVPEEIEAGSNSGMIIEYLSATDFSPDGKMLVGCVHFDWQYSGGKFKKEVKESHIIAWNAVTGKQIWKSLAGGKEVIHTILFSADGKTMTAVDKAGISFWDAAAGRKLRRWQSKDPLFSARYSSDRKWLATGSKKAILLWEVATGKVRRRLALPGKEIKAIAFSRDGKLLVGGGDKTIRFWNPQTGKARGDCSAFPSPVQAVAFSSDGKTLFSGHEQEHVLRRWDMPQDFRSLEDFGSLKKREFSSPISPVRMLSFSRDSRKILASSMAERFYLWESKTGKPCPMPKKNEDQLLTECLASSGQAALLRCEESFGSQFAMLLTGKVDRLDQLPGFLGASIDGRRVLVQSEKKKKPCLTVLKLSGNKDKLKDEIEREFLWKHGDEVSAALSPDGKTVAAAGQNMVCFFDVVTGRERRYQYPTNVKPEFLFRAQSVKFSADGSRIALAGSEGKIRILAVRDGRKIAEFATKSNRLTGLAFSPDGRTLLTTSFAAPVYMWEVATGQMVRRLKPATYLFSPDNRLLVGSAGTLKVFNLYSGRIIRECKVEGNMFGNFAFSPNSKLLAASCSDTTILVWPTTSLASPETTGPVDEKKLVEILKKGKAAKAYEAIGRIIADPKRALSILKRRLHAAAKVDDKHDPDKKQPTLSAEDVLHLRTIQALERIGTKGARQLLERLALGAELSPRTRAAVGALRRLKGH